MGRNSFRIRVFWNGSRKPAKVRESHEVQIVPYAPCYQPAFRSLNEQWITQHWQLEEHDIESVSTVRRESIIDRGGPIFVALYRGEPVGVCALCKMNDPNYDYELAKLAVSPTAQGKGISTLLCKAVIDKARELGAKTLFLESNTLLKPAIHTYKKWVSVNLPSIIRLTHAETSRWN